MSESTPTASTHRYQDVAVGMKAARDYVISPEVYEHFLSAFGDRSPVHVDEAYARRNGFKGCVMHGALLNGFLSHFVGMYFPGRFSLLLTADLRFAQPSYLGNVINLGATVSQKLDANKVVILNVIFQNVTKGYLAARGRVQVMVKDEP